MTSSPGRVSIPNSFASLFVFYILSYLLLKRMGSISGCMVSSISIQKVFVDITHHWNYLLINLWGRNWSPHPISLPSWDLLFFSVQFNSVTQFCPTLCDPWTAACQASLFITNSQSLLKLMSIESVMPSNHLIFCHPLLLPLLFPPSIFPNNSVFSSESILLIRWPKYWNFSFSISPSNAYSELITFRMDWLDLLAVQGTLKSLLQQHSSKSSILWHSAFFIVQLSHPYMTTGKTIALNRQTFVGKVTSLFF